MTAVSLFAVYAGLYYYVRGTTLFTAGDFFALWSYGHILAEHPAAELYDQSRLHQLQVDLGMPPADHNPFPYPPIFLLIVRPLGLLPLSLSYVLWIGLTLAAFVASIARPGFRLPLILAALLVPITTINVVAGQSGFLSAALLVGGLRSTGRRPWLAGMLIGLMSYKPQLALLVPVALLSASAWASILAAGAMIAGLAVASTIAFGRSVWTAWLDALPAYLERFAANSHYSTQPTVVANLAMIGVSRQMADAVQSAVAAAMAVIVWMAFRRGVTPRAIAILATATFLAIPHALIYDLCMLGAGMLVWIDARLRSGQLLNAWEPGVVGLALFLPPLMLLTKQPLSSPILLVCLLLIVTRGDICESADAGNPL